MSENCDKCRRLLLFRPKPKHNTSNSTYCPCSTITKKKRQKHLYASCPIVLLPAEHLSPQPPPYSAVTSAFLWLNRFPVRGLDFI